MESFFIKAAQLLFSLTILVTIHELGHVFFAKLFKTRVEKFYIFFNPWFSIFKFKPKNSETEYGIGWLPLGGYAKIAGMIDESMDSKQMEKPAQPWEFRSKPTWQRLLIMLGGVIFNFILALIIYSSILFCWGEKYVPLDKMSFGMDFCETAKQVGFQNGDILLLADGVKLERLDDITMRKVLEAKEVTVRRNDIDTTIQMPSDFVQQLMKAKTGFVAPRFPLVVREIVEGSPAQKAGFAPNDSLVAVNDIPTITFDDFAEMAQANKSTQMEVSLYRSGELMVIAVTPDSTGRIGVAPKSLGGLFPTVTKSYSFFAAIPAGVKLGIDKLTGYVSDMKYVFTKEGATQLGGLGTMASLFLPVWD